MQATVSPPEVPPTLYASTGEAAPVNATAGHRAAEASTGLQKDERAEDYAQDYDYDQVAAGASDASPSKPSRRSGRRRRRAGGGVAQETTTGGYTAAAAGPSTCPAEVVTCGDLGLDLFTGKQQATAGTASNMQFPEQFSVVQPGSAGCAAGFSCGAGGVARLGNTGSNS